MKNLNEKGPYTEDNFDLEEYKERYKKIKSRNAIIRKDKKTIKLLLIISTALILFIVYLSCQIFNYYIEMRKNAVIYEKAHEIARLEPVTPSANPPEVTEPPNEDFSEVVDEPIIAEPKPILEKIIKLREAFSNDDIVAYLKIDGTNIDYAVTQESNNEYYLRRDLYGEENAAGSVFMDFECDAYELGRNTVIYGHNMRNGSMFHNLRYYKDKQYYEEHRYISLTTPYEETTWEVFAFYETSTDFNYIQVVFPNINSFMSLVDLMKERSIYDTGVEVAEDDKILTLSTCSNTADDARFVINARLMNSP